MLSIISKNGEDELMLQDIPNYKLSQNYIWYGEFDVNIDGKTYHFTGSMKYTPNETFWLELLVSPDCDLTDKFMNIPTFLFNLLLISLICLDVVITETKSNVDK